MTWKRISCVLHNQMKYQVVCVKVETGKRSDWLLYSIWTGISRLLSNRSFQVFKFAILNPFSLTLSRTYLLHRNQLLVKDFIGLLAPINPSRKFSELTALYLCLHVSLSDSREDCSPFIITKFALSLKRSFSSSQTHTHALLRLRGI